MAFYDEGQDYLDPQYQLKRAMLGRLPLRPGFQPTSEQAPQLGNEPKPVIPKLAAGYQETAQPAQSASGQSASQLGREQILAPGPAARRAEELTRQGPPQYHGAKRVLDIIGQTVAPGIEARLGVGTLGYQQKLGRAQEAAQEETKQRLGQLSQTETILGRRATTAKTEAETQALQHKPAAQDKHIGSYTNEQGQRVDTFQKPDNTIYDRIGGQATQKEPSDAAYTVTKMLHPELKEGTPEFAKAWEDLRMKERTDPGLERMAVLLQRGYHPVNDAQGNTIGWANPATKDFVAAGQIPGMGGAIPPKPPSQIVAQSRVAASALPHIDSARKMIGELRGQLGPGSGRWSEFMTGKVGANDPKFAALRAEVGLIQTRLMQAHVGMRGGERLLEHFKTLIDAGKQSPDNMLAALDVIESYMKTYAAMAGGAELPPTKPEGGEIPENPYRKKR